MGEARSNRPEEVSESVSPPGATSPTSPALRSTFGFDRTDEQWLAAVRDAITAPGLGTLGPYTIIAEIGRGAQGAVFKAVQPGTQRIIAIKRLAAGAFAGASARSRFDREVETASALSHPGIVTVLGTDTIDGQPILLMEWVDGEPVDRWAFPAEQQAPGAPAGLQPSCPRPLRERLELFAQVCDAVSHAHQRGVLHRDLKPSNILVDREGRPRILDFGLAKLVGVDDPRRITRTSSAGGGGAAGIIGTPAYAAPEQLGGSATVDTRTDVYSLGVVLYQILTGRLPFDHDNDLHALIEAVRHDTPRRPSHLGDHLGDELDAVVLTALAKEPQRRYQSADALAADIRRYLDGQVVLAHPPSTAYQLRKLIARHRVAFSAVLAGAVAVCAFAVTSSILAARLSARQHDLTAALGQAQQARDRADTEASNALAAQQQAQTEASRNAASVEFLQGVLDSMARAVASGESRPARTMLLDAKATLESGRMAGQPELEVTLWRRLADTAFQLNMPIEFDEFTSRVGQLCEQRLEKDHVEMGYCRLLQGLGAEGRRDLPKAESLYREASRIFTLRLGAESPENARAINNIGCALKDLKRFDEARQCLEQALAIRTRLFGPVHRDVAVTLRNLGTLMRAQSQFDKADDYYKQALNAATGAQPRSEPTIIGIRINMCKLARESGRLDDAERMAREDLAACERVYGEDSAPSIELHKLLASVFAAQQRWDDTLATDRHILDLCRRHLPADHPSAAALQFAYAQHLMSAGQYVEAESALLAAAQAGANASPPNKAQSVDAMRQLADCLDKLNRPVEAAALRQQIQDATPAPTPPEGP